MKTLFLLLLFFTNFGLAQQHYREPATTTTRTKDFDIRITGSESNDLELDVKDLVRKSVNYALFIGIDDYQDNDIKDLAQPVRDAASLKDVLSSFYTFEQNNIIFLKNAQRKDIIDALENMSKKVTGNDNVLIFFAGHGIWDEKLNTGYWLPADAKLKDKSTYFPNSQLRDYIKAIDSKHTLLIADACFSGSIFESTRTVGEDASKSIKTLYNNSSRRAMTSGNLKEVPDKSVFAESLVKDLKKNKEIYLSAEKLFSNFKETVINASENSQIPQYGKIAGTKDEGGDFIFIRKK